MISEGLLFALTDNKEDYFAWLAVADAYEEMGEKRHADDARRLATRLMDFENARKLLNRRVLVAIDGGEICEGKAVALTSYGFYGSLTPPFDCWKDEVVVEVRQEDKRLIIETKPGNVCLVTNLEGEKR